MVRIFIGLPIAFVVTIALFLLMQYMILTEFEEQEEIETTSIELQSMREEEPQEIIDRLPKSPKPAHPPDTPKPIVPASDPSDIREDDVRITSPVNDGPANKLAKLDTPAIPILCNPTLTTQQIGQGGWVLISFDITANGSVQNPVVLDSSPAGKFDRVMLKEVQKCKFKARVKDGKAVSQTNKSYMFTLDPS